MDRRDFVKKSAITSLFTIVPSSVLSFTGKSPNDKIQLGFIGVGRQGRGLMENFIKYDSAAILSCSDVDIDKMNLFEKTYHEKSTTAKKPVHKVKKYSHYREMLNDKEIDAVVIASPDHWHAQMSIDAAKAGKDIYCEKPLSSSVAEGRAMVDATRKYDRVFQTGSMQRSWNQFRHAVELIRNGYIGTVQKVYVAIGDPYKSCDLPTQETPSNIDWDSWIGPTQYRGYHKDLACPIGDKRWAQWRDYFPYGGGMITDFGAHMFDIVQWALNMDNSGPINFEPPKIYSKNSE